MTLISFKDLSLTVCAWCSLIMYIKRSSSYNGTMTVSIMHYIMSEWLYVLSCIKFVIFCDTLHYICEIIFGIALNEVRTSFYYFLNIFILLGKHYLNLCRTNRKKVVLIEILNIAKGKIKCYKTILQKSISLIDIGLLDRLEHILWNPQL